MSSHRSVTVRVLRLRVKDKHAVWLSKLAREVNIVFNYCNELSGKVYDRERRFLSGFDFWPFLKGATRGKCACDDAGVWFDEVNEAFSTQTCSVCNSRAGPKGRKGLGVRGWQCSVCGAIHDRDVNAAQNILAAGHRRLAEGILV